MQADRHPPLQMNFALYILHAEWQISRQKDQKFLRVFREIIYSGYAHDSTGHSILIKKRRAFRRNYKTLCMVE